MTQKLLDTYSGPVPRYTSYPTAPHFSARIGADAYRRWLDELDGAGTLSLYVHVPFCDTLCWFCGCHTKITRQYRPVAEYLGALRREIEAVADLVDGACRTTHIHWGGGSPTILTPDDVAALAGTMRGAFNIDPGAEFAVEIDPRGITAAELDALAGAGVNRASIGVQDFDPQVQKAINRVQPFEETRDVISGLRERGVSGINVDLMYGLPHQTEKGIAATVASVLDLAPERIALFGYAHVPWMKRHQEMIEQSTLPDVPARHAQALFAARLLSQAGYVRIGLDHFARPDDPLAVAASAGTLRRNFQGYTTDAADALLGFGASAIGKLPKGFAQNHAPIADYMRAVELDGIAACKGYEFTPDDLRRAHVIERLMCDLALSWTRTEREIGPVADLRAETASSLQAFAHDGLIVLEEDGFRLTEEGQPFVRSVCAAFDAYLGRGNARHSIAV